MAADVDILLQKLEKGSLGYRLVSILNATPREQWSQALHNLLESRIRQKMGQSTDGKNQAFGD